MLTKAPHLFDDATRVTAGDSRWQGRTSEDYWAFVGPFGGATAATILRALIDHPQRSGDPLALTVNFCAPIAQGAFDLDVRLVKANRSTQHWSVELTQGGTEVATLATAVFAERRPSWSHQQAEFPQAPPFEATRSYSKSNLTMSWVRQYDFRFVEGEPRFTGAPYPAPASAFSKMWIGDHVPRSPQNRRAVPDVDVRRVLRPHLSCPQRDVAVWHGVADHLFSCRRRRSRSRGPPPGSRCCGRQDLPQELRRPERRTLVTERAPARDHASDCVFQGVSRGDRFRRPRLVRNCARESGDP